MLALIDYDNVHEVHRQRGLEYLAQRIADAVGYGLIKSASRLRLRLYGGWLDGVKITRRAENVSRQLVGFPRSLSVTDGTASHSVVASADIATGLLSDPRVALTHTFRPNSSIRAISCLLPPFSRCIEPNRCAIASVHGLFARSHCPQASCPVSANELLSSPEQKMVDTLLVSDLIYLAFTSHDPVVVVSNDDDMWPGIRLALLQGLPVVHVHPDAGTVDAYALPCVDARRLSPSNSELERCFLRISRES